MGNRLTKIYTRTGDSGETGLGDGSRIAKTASRVEAMGNADELNSILGILVGEPLPEPISECLVNVQHTLFDIGGELSIPGHTLVKLDRVVYLEHTLDQLNKDLPPLKDFILPGGVRSAAVCHLARSVCRRLERSLFCGRRSTVGYRCHTAVCQSTVRLVVRDCANPQPRSWRARCTLESRSSK